MVMIVELLEEEDVNKMEINIMLFIVVTVLQEKTPTRTFQRGQYFT